MFTPIYDTARLHANVPEKPKANHQSSSTCPRVPKNERERWRAYLDNPREQPEPEPWIRKGRNHTWQSLLAFYGIPQHFSFKEKKKIDDVARRKTFNQKYVHMYVRMVVWEENPILPIEGDVETLSFEKYRVCKEGIDKD
jgi:hypothetical protein